MALALPLQEAKLSPNSVLTQIGNTPLLHLPKLSARTPGVEIYAKDESQNPGGSVKDRPALNMILEGEADGRLTPGKVILEATSGNTGIAYAMIGAALGYKVKLCMPENASHERKRILAAYGAEVILTPGGEGSDGAFRRVRAIWAENPDSYFYPDQYNNPANWQAHYKTTAVEILQQTERRVTHFVAGLGTSGTCMGVTRRLREELPGIRCYSMQPDSSFHGLEGLKHMPTAIQPGIYDSAVADGNIEIDTETAHRTVRHLA
ncbi:MAG TPA: PLP-dependent cysteine synthase family protein, partial [Bryobacteraceae bacterium]|nr:PLP-dependent cysteine synthase family protein [Bryobacteraceae bacterium]